MTREEYEERFRGQYGLTEEDVELLGVHAVPCWCGGRFPGCSGWQMELRRNHSEILGRLALASRLRPAAPDLPSGGEGPWPL